MYAKQKHWSTHPVVFFSPLMLVVKKGHTYLNRPAHKFFVTASH